MQDPWLRRHWPQVLGDVADLLASIQSQAQTAGDGALASLATAEAQYAALLSAAEALGAQRHAVMATLGKLQESLAVAGHPLTGDIS